jgi:hypothetical protein
MAKGQYLSSHQKGIVNRYYSNLDTLVLQKLQEAVSELYLATSPKQADKLWKSVEASLAKAKADPAQARSIVASKNIQALAALVGDLAK